MSWEHAAEARAALNAIVADPDHGVAALSSAQTMSNLLKDLLPDAPREKTLLVAAAEADLAGKLREHVGLGMDPQTAVRLAASSFSDSNPFTPDVCAWVASELAGAMGISEPVAMGQAPAPGESAPPPAQSAGQEQGWPGAAQGFGQFGGQGFGQPSGPGFGQSGGQGFGQPSGPGFGQPGGQGFGQPGGPGFGQPGGQGLGQSGGPGFGQPGGQGSDRSGGPAFGQSGGPARSGGQGLEQPGGLRFAQPGGQAGVGQPGMGQPGMGQPGGTGYVTPGGPGFPQAPGGAFGGAPAVGMMPGGYQGPRKNGMAIAALVCGIVQFVLWIVFVVPGLITAILAIIFGAVSLRRIKATGEGGRGMAITGIICGALGIVGVTLLVILGVIFAKNHS